MRSYTPETAYWFHRGVSLPGNSCQADLSVTQVTPRAPLPCDQGETHAPGSRQVLTPHTPHYHDDILGGTPHLGWDLSFLLVGGIGFMLAGWLLAHYRSGKAGAQKNRL